MFRAVCVVLLLLVARPDLATWFRCSFAVDAIMCYQCSGRTGDSACGTPFNENGIATCEAKACLTTRILKQMKQGSGSGTAAAYPTCGSWTLSPDSSVRTGGKSMTAVTTLHECHVACVNQEDCIGVDWKPTKSPGQNCWLLPIAAPRNIVADPGNSHFDFIRSSSCWPCGVLWTALVGVRYMGGTANTVTGLSDCLTACINDVNCVGVDWTPNDNLGQKCWQYGALDAGSFASTKDATHYDLIRSPACERAYELITRSCSRTIRRQDVTCHDMRGVQRGIECSCTLDACNGDDEMMISVEYAGVRDVALFGGVGLDGGGAVDSSAKRKLWLGSKSAKTAINRSTQNLSDILTSSIVIVGIAISFLIGSHM